jgi:hypothetical protein
VNFERVEEIAEAVLYEGYMLYPYRPSSVKNQQRFNFGVLYPQSYCDLQTGSESNSLRIQCLLKITPSSRLTVKVRFLQIVQRLIRKYDGPNPGEYINRLELDGKKDQPWQEAEERSFTLDSLDSTCLNAPYTTKFSFPPGETVEPLHDAKGNVLAEIVRRWEGLSGSLQLYGEQPCANVVKLTARVENSSSFDTSTTNELSRDIALLHSLVSAHAILGVENGEFVSLLEPPAELEDVARSCENTGAWPVLAGDDATTVLASPIILYDYPTIAPESAGNLFDATEIDEILSLRILTLTDEEKAEICQADDRARQLLERTENIPDEQFMKLHGVLRGLTAFKEDPQ